jgi:hypothetical protein
MRPILYLLTILVVPGGFLFCIVNILNRRRKKRLAAEARINRITRGGLVSMPDRNDDAETWERAPHYGHGSASQYVPDWAVPMSKHPKRRKTDVK